MGSQQSSFARDYPMLNLSLQLSETNIKNNYVKLKELEDQIIKIQQQLEEQEKLEQELKRKLEEQQPR